MIFRPEGKQTKGGPIEVGVFALGEQRRARFAAEKEQE